MSAHILITDDDRRIRAGFVGICQALGHRTLEAGTLSRALELASVAAPEVVLLDLDLPDGSGLELLPRLIGLEHGPAVIVITGLANVATAVEAMRLGAADFLQKPVRAEALEGVLARVLRGRAVERERDLLRSEVARLRSGPIVGTSRETRRLHEAIDRVASTPRTTVLVTGESGVGKELVARAIHDRSARASGPFVALNCATLASGMLEAELFGYEAGAFTGALPKGREGLFSAAEGGTLFLDEIGELVPELQAKLLRVLQERSYRRVGGTEDRLSDVRIIASTNRDLGAMVEEGRFREDLFYRLNVLSLVVPPLRERRDDIALLAESFLERISEECGRSAAGFEPDALEHLEHRAWPGNIRELRNVVERAALHAGEGPIAREHVGAELPSRTPRPASGPVLELEDFRLRTLEEALIRCALDESDGNRSQTARMLGVNRTTLYNKLKAYGI